MEASLIKGKLGRGTLGIARVPLPLFVLIRAIRFQPLRELKPYHLAKNTHTGITRQSNSLLNLHKAPQVPHMSASS